MALMLRTLLCAVFATLLLTACQSDEEKKQREAEMYRTVPLDFDPTEKYDLARWWSNGQQLLRLEDDASYAIYQGASRYTKPIERGRWSQDGFAVLWLEPYSRKTSEPTRVSIRKIDGKIALQIRDLEPMFGLAAPPTSTEDKIIGVWKGPLGTLHLRPDLRYTLTPAENSSRQGGAFIAGHDGAWALTARGVRLTPDAPSLQPMVLNVKFEKDRAALEGPGGALTAVAQ